jgi:hypothetical protein
VFRLEMQEYEAWVRSDDDPELLNAPAVAQWQELVDEASIKFGKRINIAEGVEQRMKEAGFGDVRDDIYKVSSPLRTNKSLILTGFIL